MVFPACRRWPFGGGFAPLYLVGPEPARRVDGRVLSATNASPRQEEEPDISYHGLRSTV